ncbi:unnamed protein product [Menidia menidia]|uniref:(Atlantic silverside) hypothetical protein n=1 Tax=Menidia menidia TaxID=238744 RepID=A0A8S4BFB9_9TELE|nr:unnamed protein product [Menidia menidia]
MFSLCFEGFLLDFVSYPVIKGFTCAAAVTIGFGQVKNILGLRGVPQQFFLEVYCTLSRVPEARVGDVVLGLICLVLLAALSGMKATLGSEEAPTLTLTRAARKLGFGGGLAVIPFMGLLESIAIAKAFASQNDYRIDANQELLAIGVTNVMGSFVSAYPVTGSFGRTAVNSQTGVCTPAGGLITSAIVLLSLAFLMPAFYYIPKASLAAVIICAVAPMVDYRVVAKMWRIHRLDLLPFFVTFLVSFWEVQYGIIGGVAVSGALLLYRAARPQIKVSDHGVLVMELNSGLIFPASEHLSHIIHTQALQGRLLLR